MSGFLSTSEVAARMGVTSDSVVKWIRKGKLKAITTPGGHHRIAVEEVDRIAPRALRVEPAPAPQVNMKPPHALNEKESADQREFVDQIVKTAVHVLTTCDLLLHRVEEARAELGTLIDTYNQKMKEV